MARNWCLWLFIFGVGAFGYVYCLETLCEDRPTGLHRLRRLVAGVTIYWFAACAGAMLLLTAGATALMDWIFG